MKNNWWSLPIVCSLLATGCAGRGGGPRAAVYPKARVLPSPCDAAWPQVLSIISDAGFRLVAKDDAGQIARFMYLQPQLPEIVRTVDEADKLAIAPDGSGQKSRALRIESAVLALNPAPQGCEVKISVSYQAQSGVWGRNWTRVESSGLLENRVLSELRVGAVGGRQRSPRGAGPRQAAARLARSNQVTIVGGDLPQSYSSAAYDLARQ